MRHGLLITAVATVTVPGLLAILAVRGQAHVGPQAGVAAAIDGTSLSGPFPVESATAQTAVRDNVAAVQQASGTPVTVLNRVTASQQVMGMRLLDGAGMRLLDSAAAASLSKSYQGIELTTQQGVGGSVTMVSQVWHQAGGATVVETSSGASPAVHPPASSDVASSDLASASPEGVFGVTKSLVALLGKHYVAVYKGRGAALGRTATIVDIYRFDGSLAARYWLDGQAMVPLRREVFDTSDNVISEDSFVQVSFGAPAPPQSTAAPASQPAWVAAAPPGRFLASLSEQGWQVPGMLPGGLPLYAAAWAKTANGKVVDLEYSDGLFVVSLFVQRGTLATDMPGWREVSVAGQQSFVSGHSVTWSGSGFVYTMIADAPPQTVRQVVGALPASGSPGVLARLGRGLIRIASVINPFG